LKIGKFHDTQAAARADDPDRTGLIETNTPCHNSR
jgi:hypothetical protein